MALPTTPKYWTNRKGLYEQAIVRHRNQETDFRQKWSETADYFHKNNVQAAKQTQWGSAGLTARSHQDKCTNVFQQSCEREMKAMKLKTRQDKLKQLLTEESREYEAQLKGMSKENFLRIGEMKDRVEGLRSAREEKRKQIAEEKLYDHWQQNNPDIRKIQTELMKDDVVGHWSEQQEEARLKAQYEREEKQKMEQQMEEERLAGLEQDKDKEEDRRREQFELKEHLHQQMTELKRRESEAQELKRQHDLLLQQQWEMEKVESERNYKEEQRQKKNLGRALLHQHKTQMMHKSRLIQQELNQDRQLLQEMIDKQQDEITLHTARKEKARADAQWMKQVIEDQLRLEKAREAEMDMLFQDEAARMWHQREGEWERERKARQRLMDEVLEGRQEQISDKLEEVARRQQEGLVRREELLLELEMASQLTQREQQDARREQEDFKHNLQEQISERQHVEKMAKLNLRQEEDEELQAETEYNDFLHQETGRLRQKGFTPRGKSKRGPRIFLSDQHEPYPEGRDLA